MDSGSVVELTVYMWACVRGACRRMGVDFPWDNPRDFADQLEPADIEKWSNSMAGGQSGGSDDKKNSR